MTAELEALSLDELRSRRDELRSREEAISYRRRLLQAQLDIVEAAGSVSDPDELSFMLGRVLSDGPGPAGGPARSMAIADVDTGADVAPLPADLVELDGDERVALLARLRAEERTVSDQRRSLLAELDEIQEALVQRFRRDGVDARSLLSGGDQ